jgi:heat shock protein HslJ
MSMRPIFPLLIVAGLAGCATAPGPVNTAGRLPPEVAGVTWQWVSMISRMGELRPDVPEHYTIRFDDGRAQIRADCNSGSAPIGVGDNRQLQIGPPFAMTRMACPSGSLDHDYLTNLGRVRWWSLQDGRLYMRDAGAGSSLMFQPSPGPE